ncbi:DUF5017 domain-containing protein [Pedobacter helvus]|uniref:DUF5017 domain-containing protein n=1 Tax=Pedobacter helvus TaxID=2563444 RepID=A0ABW9JP93_9SPHI|nr:DUF5017 domain-containing protein [Pedobacter ureilyticus]
MKNILKFSMLLFITVIVSCKKDTTDSPDGFNIYIEKTMFHVGDTAVFNISGSPDVIVFYSGTVGSRYNNRERLTSSGINKLSFQSSMTNGLLANAEPLSLLISTNLNGYDATSIASATWTDITNRNTKWPTSLSTAYTTSDAVDISDFNTADKVNIAFRAQGKKYPSQPQRKWSLQNITLNNVLSDGTNTPLFSTFANTGWVQLSVKNSNSGFNAWNVGDWNQSSLTASVNSSGVVLRNAYPITFDPGTTVNNDENDDWLITSAIDLKKTRPDAGIVIKSYLDLPLKQHSYVFKTAGTFKVAFVATNTDDKNVKSVVKEVTIIVN